MVTLLTDQSVLRPRLLADRSCHLGAGSTRTDYYEGKLQTLQDLFGTPAVRLESGHLVVRDKRYPIVDDVIVLLAPSEHPKRLVQRIGGIQAPAPPKSFCQEIQDSFGEEWTSFSDMLPEHELEFRQYFDLVDLSRLTDYRIGDLGCGIGRWSYFLHTFCRELVLVDFSDAIFMARRNLAAAPNAYFFMGDLTRLPFRRDFADLIVCLGVLHHLNTPALAEARALKRWAPRLLIYLYYALDNRPFHFRLLLAVVTAMRLALRSTCREPRLRNALTWLLMGGLYLPLLALGGLMDLVDRGRYVPLYETYAGKSLRRIRQDVYDRFFTAIEQRHYKREILELTDTFGKVTVSTNAPYWHFFCER